jgi:hypothetical protein
MLKALLGNHRPTHNIRSLTLIAGGRGPSAAASAAAAAAEKAVHGSANAHGDKAAKPTSDDRSRSAQYEVELSSGMNHGKRDMVATGDEGSGLNRTRVPVTSNQEDDNRTESRVVGGMGVASEDGDGPADKPVTEQQRDWGWGLFGWDEDPWTGEGRHPKGQLGVAVLDVTRQREVFNYLTLSSDMIEDHLPDSYTRAIAELARK